MQKNTHQLKPKFISDATCQTLYHCAVHHRLSSMASFTKTVRQKVTYSTNSTVSLKTDTLQQQLISHPFRVLLTNLRFFTYSTLLLHPAAHTKSLQLSIELETMSKTRTRLTFNPPNGTKQVLPLAVDSLISMLSA